jgi:hypothetical protein
VFDQSGRGQQPAESSTDDHHLDVLVERITIHRGRCVGICFYERSKVARGFAVLVDPVRT